MRTLRCAVLFVFQHGIANYLNLPTSVLVATLAVGVAFYVPLGSRRGYIQGTYKFKMLATNLVIEGLCRLSRLGSAVSGGYGVEGVIAANTAAVAIAYLTVPPNLVGAFPTRCTSPLPFAKPVTR